MWNPGPVLDQGREGACVGFGWAAELQASPVPVKNVSNATARQLYLEAKKVDEWEGENYEGTSVLAGAKVVKSKGFIGSYRWCFGVNEVRDSVLTLGPVVIGINWYQNMYRARPSGLVEVGGALVGGHCILLTGYHPRMRIKGEGWWKRYDVFRWRNSWGPSYGNNGTAYIKTGDLADLLGQDGEACVPVQRMKGAL